MSEPTDRRMTPQEAVAALDAVADHLRTPPAGAGPAELLAAARRLEGIARLLRDAAAEDRS